MRQRNSQQQTSLKQTDGFAAMDGGRNKKNQPQSLAKYGGLANS